MENPLSECKPESLDELFSRNPADLSEAELDRIVEAYRAQRELWVRNENLAKAPKVKAEPKSKTPKPKITLEDLGL